MPVSPVGLTVLLFAPPLSHTDDRPAAVARAVETAIPSASLTFTVAETGELVPLPDRDSFLRDAAGRAEFPIICDADRGNPVVLNGIEWPAVAAPGGRALLQVILQISRSELTDGNRATELLALMGQAAEAYWGTASPDAAAALIGSQVVHDPSSESPPAGLPALQPWTVRSDPAVPGFLGWINYWSGTTLARLGVRSEDLAERFRQEAVRLNTGGWVFRTTTEPLRLDRSDHLEALARAYAWWPQIGNRA